MIEVKHTKCKGCQYATHREENGYRIWDKCAYGEVSDRLECAMRRDAE